LSGRVSNSRRDECELMATDIDQPDLSTEEGSAAESSGEDAQSLPERGWMARLSDAVDSFTSPANLKLGGLVIFGFLLLMGLVYLVTREEAPSNADKLIEALGYLEEGKDALAARIAQELQQLGYQDPDFPGGDQFVLGIVAFRQAEQLSEDEGREQKYLVAKSFLQEAQERALTEDYEAEWAYALGISLYRIGRANAAQPLLEKAAEAYAPGKIESGLLLADTYLYSKTSENLDKARTLNATLIELPGLTDRQRDRAFLQRAQILYALEEQTAAEAALAEVQSQNDGITILRAEVLMKAGKYEEALQKLRPVESSEGLQQQYPRQARYLMGMCKQQLAHIDPDNRKTHFEAARNYYERTYKQYSGTHEAVAAQLWAADILRRQEFHEKALETFSNVLRQVHDPQEFSNKWIDVKVFRDVVLDAWNAWNSAHLYNHSIALADHMSPLFPISLSREYSAVAKQKAAQYLTWQLDHSSAAERKSRQLELRARWLRSGQAFAELALERKTTSFYPDDLWMAAEDFMNARAYERAVNYWTLFIETNPTVKLPPALVRKGIALMQLELFEDALLHFQRVVTSHPRHAVAFQARYLIGECYFQTNQQNLAEQAWRDILTSDQLTPAAAEWQESLFSLGKLLHLTAAEIVIQADEVAASDPPKAAELRNNAYRRWEEAILRLENYINRYDLSKDEFVNPSYRERAKRLTESQYYLAKACQRSAEFQMNKMELAETDNARSQFYKQMRVLLEQSNKNYERLKGKLLIASDVGQLDELGRQLLLHCYFEIPKNYFDMGDFQSALTRYREAAGRYQDRPDALQAMVQEANCYDRLQRPLDARGALAQAKFMLEQIPEQNFAAGGAGMSKEQWRAWLQWAIKLHQQPAQL